MPASGPVFIEIGNSSRGKLSGFLEQLPGCWKCSSILWMRSNGLPVLDGLILGGWNVGAEKSVVRLSRERGFSELLVRIEAPGKRWTVRRGGYTIPLTGVQQQVEQLTSAGFLTILLEPASPYSDMFSLTSVCEADTGRIDIEVVGPGFDASDTLRSDLLPHERYEVRSNNQFQMPLDASKLQSTRTYLIDEGRYMTSVRQRLAKIGARLRDPAFPDELIKSSSAGAQEELASEATRYLRESGNTTLLAHSDHYQPISGRFLDKFLAELVRLCRAVAESKVPWRTFSIAAGFLPGDRLVFWDFFPPGDNNDVSTLLQLKA